MIWVVAGASEWAVMLSRSHSPELAQTPQWGVWLVRNSLCEHDRPLARVLRGYRSSTRAVFGRLGVGINLRVRSYL